jgi:hypothetical protein
MHLRTSLILSLLVALGAAAEAQNVVKYHATINDVKYVYGVAQPVGPL